jgi:small subunit ribosomal protein S1
MEDIVAKHEINFKPLETNQMVKGTVISVNKSEVLVDLDGMTTGIIRKKELSVDDGEDLALNPGDEIEAMVTDLENEIDMVELSLRFAGHQKAWETLRKQREENKIVKAKVLDANKGGLLISVNAVAGFLPVSQLNPEHYPRVPGGDKNKILEKLKSYVGEDFEVKVFDVDEEQNKLIVSEKAAWEETQKDILDKYKVNEVIDGTVTAVTDFGVFVKFGENLEGLVHISELAWQRIDDPNELFKVGQAIKAEIINIEGSKIFLSIKKLQRDPWIDIDKRYTIGQMVEGKVKKANPFGLFVELDDEIHGLAHISELSDKPVTDVSAIAKAGDTLSFRIVSIEPKEHRLGLSLRPAREEKAEEKKEEKPAEEVKE